jgi:hypothetical protein
VSNPLGPFQLTTAEPSPQLSSSYASCGELREIDLHRCMKQPVGVVGEWEGWVGGREGRSRYNVFRFRLHAVTSCMNVDRIQQNVAQGQHIAVQPMKGLCNNDACMIYQM